MLHNKENTDLEYLAELGFEKVNVGEPDIGDLHKRIKSRSFSYNNAGFFGLISLLTGTFLGISVFFIFYSSPLTKISTISVPVKTSAKQVSYELSLDTINITHENFINPVLHSKPARNKINPAYDNDTITISNLPISVYSPSVQVMTEAKIKYVPNAPVIFLHDMKITDYSRLYFQHNRFISLRTQEGLDPSYANASEKHDNVLTPESHYYLHEAISDAMLFFSRKEYTRCLNTLQVIIEINPDDINSKFYSGMCYYYKKDFKNAINQFEDCINNPNNTFLNEATYYKALSRYNNGDKEEAIKLLREISEEGTFYSEKAKQFLKQD